MEGKCRVAVIGVGQRGYYYVQLLQAHPQVEVAALCDSSSERLSRFAEELHCDNLPLFHSCEELLAYGDFDAAVITTPDFQHAACAIACFRAGKHVMLEKPMAPTAPECREIISAWRASGKILQIGFVLRCLPLYQAMKKHLDSGELGQLLSMNFSESLGLMHGASYMRRWHRKSCNSGGFLLAKCSHDLDLMVEIANSLPVRAASFGGLNFFTHDKQNAAFCSECGDQSCRFRFHGEMVRMTPEEIRNPANEKFDLCVFNDDKDIVDNQQVLLEFANGVRGTFSLNLFAPEAKREWRLVCTNGYLNADTSTKELTIAFSDGRPAVKEHCATENQSGHDGSDQLFLNEFVKCIQTGTPPVASEADGLASTVLGNAIELARRENRIVEIPQDAYRI